jgi:hypothetical protein
LLRHLKVTVVPVFYDHHRVMQVWGEG